MGGLAILIAIWIGFHEFGSPFARSVIVSWTFVGLIRSEMGDGAASVWSGGCLILNWIRGICQIWADFGRKWSKMVDFHEFWYIWTTLAQFESGFRRPFAVMSQIWLSFYLVWRVIIYLGFVNPRSTDTTLNWPQTITDPLKHNGHQTKHNR